MMYILYTYFIYISSCMHCIYAECIHTDTHICILHIVYRPGSLTMATFLPQDLFFDLQTVLFATIVTVYQPLIATSKPHRFHHTLVAWHTAYEVSGCSSGARQ